MLPPSKPIFLAVSGVKNSGKTTLIARLIPKLTEKGLRVATIKHDGHDFSPDVPGTDSYAHRASGAFGTAVFSDRRFLVTKETPGITEQELMLFFPEADLILLEGFKASDYPKLELVRDAVSEKPVTEPSTRIALISDVLKTDENGAKTLHPDDIEAITEAVWAFYEEVKHHAG